MQFPTKEMGRSGDSPLGSSSPLLWLRGPGMLFALLTAGRIAKTCGKLQWRMRPLISTWEDHPINLQSPWFLIVAHLTRCPFNTLSHSTAHSPLDQNFGLRWKTDGPSPRNEPPMIRRARHVVRPRHPTSYQQPTPSNLQLTKLSRCLLHTSPQSPRNIGLNHRKPHRIWMSHSPHTDSTWAQPGGHQEQQRHGVPPSQLDPGLHGRSQTR